MRLPGFTAETSLQPSIGTYRTRSSYAGGKPRIHPQQHDLTPRPDRPPGGPRPHFPPLPDDYPVPGPSCDMGCLWKCRAFYERACEGDSFCVFETMPVCENRCCIAPRY